MTSSSATLWVGEFLEPIGSCNICHSFVMRFKHSAGLLNTKWRVNQTCVSSPTNQEFELDAQWNRTKATSWTYFTTCYWCTHLVRNMLLNRLYLIKIDQNWSNIRFSIIQTTKLNNMVNNQLEIVATSRKIQFLQYLKY